MRVGLNGFGRIGRAIYRINNEKQSCEVVAVNDINPDTENMAYLLRYDSTYGRFDGNIEVDEPHLIVDGQKIRVTHERKIEDVDWAKLGVDLVIDASGVHDNVLAAKALTESGVRKVVVTHSPPEVDQTLVLGVNEASYDPDRHHVVSSSICDAVAAAPVLKHINDAIGVQTGFLTTLHPWLAYQNLLDGPSMSWAMPGALYQHYAIGRASPGSLIPKPTTAIEATLKVLPELTGAMQCMSFRIPTQTVGSANLYLSLKRSTTVDEVEALFKTVEGTQRWPIIHNTREPLVSVDVAGTEFSAVVDHRWTALSDGSHLFLVLWYDNEWGYCSRVVDLVSFLGEGLT
jgi:glyceraldehyde 3-phosphate dehydrogenase